MVFQRHAFFRKGRFHNRIALLSRAVDMVERLLRGFQGHEFHHLPVHPQRPQGPPKGNDQRSAVVDSKLPFCLLFCLGKEISPDRRARHDDLLRMAVVLPAGLEAHQDTVRVRLQHFRRQPWHRVGLVDCRGNPHFCRGLHQRIACVAPSAHDHIRLEFPQNHLCLPGRSEQIAHGNKIVLDFPWPEGPVKAGNMHGPEGIASLWNQVLFQPPFRAHEEEFHCRVLLRHQLRQGDGRIHMTRCAAAGKGRSLNLPAHCTPSPLTGFDGPHLP